MNIRTLLGIAACLALAGCAHQRSARRRATSCPTRRARKSPANGAARIAAGDVVPNWIRTFGDPATHRARRGCRRAESRPAEPPPRAWRRRAHAVRSRRVVALSAHRDERARRAARAARSPAIGALGIDPPDLGGLGVDISGGAADTSSVDSLVAALGLRHRHRRFVGSSMCGAASARGRPRRKPTAPRSKPTTNSPGNRSPPPVARAYFSTIEAAQQEANAQETLGLYEDYLKLTDVRKQQGFASDFELAQVKSRTAGAQRHAASPRRARARRPSAPSRSSPATIPRANSACAAPFPAQPRRRARRAARANPRTPARHRRRRAPLRRGLSSHERSPHRAPAALLAQRHRRPGHRATRQRRRDRSRELESRRRRHPADLLRRRTQGRAGHPHRRAESRRRQLRRRRACARSRMSRMRSPTITTCASAKARSATWSRPAPRP